MSITQPNPAPQAVGHDANGLPLDFGRGPFSPPFTPKPSPPPPPKVDKSLSRFAKSSHAAQRAAERYGLCLSWDDLRAIALICRNGAGCTGRMAGGREYHMVIFADRVLFVIYRRDAPGERAGVVLTVLPQECAEHVIRHNTRQRRQRLKIYPRQS